MADEEREPPEQGAAAAGEAAPSAEELIEQFRQLKVSDLLVSTVFTLSQVGYGKLDAASRDLDQARLAIEALRALVPLLEGTLPDETIGDFRQVTANLQLAYAAASKEAGGGG